MVEPWPSMMQRTRLNVGGTWEHVWPLLIRRKLLLSQVSKFNKNYKVLFIESICTDELLIEKNISLKANSPDYRVFGEVYIVFFISQDVPNDEAIADFKSRLLLYEERYQPLDDGILISANSSDSSSTRRFSSFLYETH